MDSLKKRVIEFDLQDSKPNPKQLESTGPKPRIKMDLDKIALHETMQDFKSHLILNEIVFNGTYFDAV